MHLREERKSYELKKKELIKKRITQRLSESHSSAPVTAILYGLICMDAVVQYTPQAFYTYLIVRLFHSESFFHSLEGIAI